MDKVIFWPAAGTGKGREPLAEPGDRKSQLNELWLFEHGSKTLGWQFLRGSWKQGLLSLLPSFLPVSASAFLWLNPSGSHRARGFLDAVQSGQPLRAQGGEGEVWLRRVNETIRHALSPNVCPGLRKPRLGYLSASQTHSCLQAQPHFHLHLRLQPYGRQRQPGEWGCGLEGRSGASGWEMEKLSRPLKQAHAGGRRILNFKWNSEFWWGIYYWNKPFFSRIDHRTLDLGCTPKSHEIVLDFFPGARKNLFYRASQNS